MSATGTGLPTAFVTGGSGFVGSNLIAELVQRGWHVTALHRSPAQAAALSALGATPAEGDLAVRDSVLAAMPAAPDAVFHVAGDTSLWSRRNARQDAVNVAGTAAVVDAALARGAKRFIHTSTCSAYGRHAAPITETTPSTAPQSRVNYERSKWRAEQEVRRGIAAGLDAVILNPFAILGPGDRHGWARLFFQVRDGQFKMAPPGIITCNHVHEVVRAHISAVDFGRRGENYLLGGPVTSVADLAGLMGAAMGLDVHPKPAPPALLKLVAGFGTLTARFTGREPSLTPEVVALMSAETRCASNKAERELDYRPVELAACVRDAHAWLRAQSLL